MPNEWSLGELHMYVKREGLGRALEHGISSDKILDPELRIMWERLQLQMRSVRNYLELHEHPGLESIGLTD